MSTEPGTNPYSSLEGSWGQFLIMRIQPEHYSRVFEHIKTNFLKQEPLCSLLGWTEPFSEELCKLVEIMLDQKLSCFAIHQETNQVAGVRITFSSKITHLLDQVKLNQTQTEVFWNRIDISEEQRAEIFAQFGTDEYAEFFIASTTPKYQNQGLASELYKRSLTYLSVLGYKVVKSIFTSPKSRHIAIKLGFVEISNPRIYYKDLKGLNGEFVFKDISLTDECYACAMVKPLNYGYN